jgi:aryl sulfotransferase
MYRRMKPMRSVEGYQKGLDLKLTPTDVVITPYGKSGTTWTQQIVHTLRTRGDMDFDDISRVVPWIETSVGLGLDLDATQKAEPRAFKSHLGWDLVPKGGRYINVVRDPGDVIVSLLKFQEGWFLEPGCISVDEFAEAEFLKSRSYYKHLLSWWPRRNDPDVLFLAYEKMLQAPSETIRRIASFIGIELDDELLAIVEEHSSLDFMLAHKDRFDDAMFRKRSEEVCGLPAGSDSAKVREGKAGSKRLLSEATLNKLNTAWQEEIEAALGFKDYASLIAELK